MHTDIYGRQWRFKPDHDTANMLQISDSLAARGYNAARVLSGVFGTYGQLAAEGPLEPYLLKLPGDTWCMGMRFGDEGHEYYSPGLNQNIIRAMLDYHRAECGPAELLIYTKLMGERA